MSQRSQSLLQLAISATVLALAAAVFAGLYFTKPDPKRSEAVREATLVDVVVVHSERHQLALEAYGQVVPAQQVSLVPEVGGRVVYVNDGLTPGARFSKGDVLARIDSRNYRAALQQQTAALRQAEVERELERGRSIVARQEWQLFGEPEAGAENQESLTRSRSRALREPQLRSAEVAVEAAASGLTKARLDLGRTTLRAPFDALVLSEGVDVGQVVGAGSSLATLVGTDAFWVEVSVPVWALSHLRIPVGADGDGPPAQVHLETARSRRAVQGVVKRVLGNLEQAGRLARLLVEIPDPLTPVQQDPPLLLGAYVRVTIDVGESEPAFEIPRRALREGSSVWVMDDQNRLQIRNVNVVWREQETVLVAGLEPASRVITSRIPTPVNGLALRVAEDAPAHGGAAPQARRSPPEPDDDNRRLGAEP